MSNSSDFVVLPEAICKIKLKNFLPDSATVSLQSAMVQHSISMSSCMCSKIGVLDTILMGGTAGIDDIFATSWLETVNINLNGQFYCATLAVPFLKQSSNPSIVTMSSLAGRLGYAYRSPYAVTKWAIAGVAKSLYQQNFTTAHGHRVRCGATRSICMLSKRRKYIRLGYQHLWQC